MDKDTISPFLPHPGVVAHVQIIKGGDAMSFP